MGDLSAAHEFDDPTAGFVFQNASRLRSTPFRRNAGCWSSDAFCRSKGCGSLYSRFRGSQARTMAQVIVSIGIKTAIFWLGMAAISAAQTPLTLRQAGSRVPPDSTPAYHGKDRVVIAVLSALPLS